MLEYDRIDITKRIDVNEINTSKECGICHYWYFKDMVLNMNHVFAMVVMV